MKIDVPLDADPMFFFRMLFTDELLEKIVKKTNEYAKGVIASDRPARRRSLRNKWTDVTADEMRKFVGLILHMGLVSLPSYNLYWSTDRLYKNTFFSSAMSRERFQSAILAFWRKSVIKGKISCESYKFYYENNNHPRKEIIHR